VSVQFDVEGFFSRLRRELSSLRPEPAALLAMSEAARLLACSRKHLQRLVAANVVMVVEVGGLKRIPRSEVERIARTPASRRAGRKARVGPRTLAMSPAAELAKLRELRAKRRPGR
jgi:excisionase family DNA binding protein